MKSSGVFLSLPLMRFIILQMACAITGVKKVCRICKSVLQRYNILPLENISELASCNEKPYTCGILSCREMLQNPSPKTVGRSGMLVLIFGSLREKRILKRAGLSTMPRIGFLERVKSEANSNISIAVLAGPDHRGVKLFK